MRIRSGWVFAVPPSAPEQVVITPSFFLLWPPQPFTHNWFWRDLKQLQAASQTVSFATSYSLSHRCLSHESDTSALCPNPKEHHYSVISNGVIGHSSWTSEGGNQELRPSAACQTVPEVIEAKTIAEDWRARIASGRAVSISPPAPPHTPTHSRQE